MKVAVTGTDLRLGERLQEAGFEVVSVPLIRVEEIDGPAIDAERYDWILVTSRNAVGPLLRRLTGAPRRVAAIGPGTADALRAGGVQPAFVAERSTQEGLAEELPRPQGPVLHAAAEDARDVLVRELGAELVPLYRTAEVELSSFPDADLVVIASASAARALAALRIDLACVSIGPVTSEQARSDGLRVVAEAETHDLDGLVAAVKLAASHASSSPS
ncbi:MAG TPA: uroporphyrinogen-III synthase [Gaiellaceae bacterium]|nr:uroporphyrinogen-III synthase [Gaiellaceae bacterium]